LYGHSFFLLLYLSSFNTCLPSSLVYLHHLSFFTTCLSSRPLVLHQISPLVAYFPFDGFYMHRISSSISSSVHPVASSIWFLHSSRLFMRLVFSFVTSLPSSQLFFHHLSFAPFMNLMDCCHPHFTALRSSHRLNPVHYSFTFLDLQDPLYLLFCSPHLRTFPFIHCRLACFYQFGPQQLSLPTFANNTLF
jgi:hypothetical protein